MSEPVSASRRGVELRPTRLDDPVAARLVDELQADLAVRYGEPDPVATDADEFWPPRGIFLVAWVGGRPAGCAGLKELDSEVGELKRMYVAPHARGRGVARALLAGLEEHARAAGTPRLRLITGEAQPEAVALYASAGWQRGALYGPAIEFGWREAIAFERVLRQPATPAPPASAEAATACGSAS